MTYSNAKPIAAILLHYSRCSLNSRQVFRYLKFAERTGHYHIRERTSAGCQGILSNRRARDDS